jgi:glycosyltransferase involved in cell wall biosynthesis
MNKMLSALRLAFLYIAFAIYFICKIILIKNNQKKLIWGVTPLTNNRYWSKAMMEAGYDSITFMTHHYSNSNREDFDLYFDDILPKWTAKFGTFINLIKPYFALLYILENAKYLHCSFNGGALGSTIFWRSEAWLLKKFNIKTIVLVYGSDAYMYSKILNQTFKHAVMSTYPQFAKEEFKIHAKVEYWNKNADIVMTGWMLDGMGRWDVMLPSNLVIDTKSWTPKINYSNANGSNEIVKIIHTPNHRGFKGTEFIIDAVERLQNEGFRIELILLEGVANDLVQQRMREADILIEQIMFTGYALSAIEGMASGLPVICNLEDPAYTNVFRTYSFLSECPILSASSSNLYERLKILVKNPELRNKLGKAGLDYVSKYHAYRFAQHLYSSIYKKIEGDNSFSLINLYHPLTSEYSKSLPKIDHPLVENCLSEAYRE